MCENDSFNDSDEFFNLYSFKKVTQTYKDQLNKLMKRKVYSSDECTKTDKNVSDYFNDDSINLELSLSPKPKKSSDVIDIDDSSDIVEVISGEGLRRSSRLKKKNNCNDTLTSTTYQENLPVLRSRVRKKGRKKQVSSNKEPDEVVLDDSQDSLVSPDYELNPELSIKVIWKSIEVKKFPIRKYQKMSKIYQVLAKEENTTENRILLTFKNAKIDFNDTPASLNLQIFDFLEGGILSETTSHLQGSTSHEKMECNKDAIILKFRDVNKKVVELSMNKNDTMKIAMIKYSEQLEIEFKKIKFFFDGELLDASETPTSLALEDQDIIDTIICND